MQISAQTDNHNLRKKYAATDKKFSLRKIDFKFRKPKFNILCNIALHFL